jgi:peroxiredoxin
MKTLGFIALLGGFGVTVAGCQQEMQMTAPATVTKPAIPTRAEDVRPLKEGQRAPSATLLRPGGQPVTLSAAYSTKPSILIFYRGGWCPYCNTHLGQIAQVEADLVKLGYQVLAISPDQPEALRDSLNKGGFGYELLSDSDMELSRAFGLAFRVDDETVEKYRGFGIDLDKASGRDHHLLPVPAVYIVDTQGVIRFAHWSADYRERLDPEVLLQAARAASQR